MTTTNVMANYFYDEINSFVNTNGNHETNANRFNNRINKTSIFYDYGLDNNELGDDDGQEIVLDGESQIRFLGNVKVWQLAGVFLLFCILLILILTFVVKIIKNCRKRNTNNIEKRLLCDQSRHSFNSENGDLSLNVSCTGGVRSLKCSRRKHLCYDDVIKNRFKSLKKISMISSKKLDYLKKLSKSALIANEQQQQQQNLKTPSVEKLEQENNTTNSNHKEQQIDKDNLEINICVSGKDFFLSANKLAFSNGCLKLIDSESSSYSQMPPDSFA